MTEQFMDKETQEFKNWLDSLEATPAAQQQQQFNSNDPLTAARSLLAAGYSVVPLQMAFNAEGKKSPHFVVSWKDYQYNAMTEEGFEALYRTRDCNAIAILTGFGDNPLLQIDFDDITCWEPYIEQVKNEHPELISKLCIESTPKGKHVYCNYSNVGQNEKLAMQGGQVRIETRGRGGLSFCAPTERYTIESGAFEGLPAINDEEANYLLNLARSFNVDEVKSKPSRPVQDTATIVESTPINNYNKDTDPRTILENNGWTLHSESCTDYNYTRPGKDTSEGLSASVSKDGEVKLTYIFSSNTTLDEGRAYTPFQLYTHYSYNDDETAAFNSLLPSHNNSIPGTELNLDTNAHGKVLCTLDNLQKILLQHPAFSGLRFNEFSEQLDFTAPFEGYTGPLDDPRLALIHLWLERNYGLSVSDRDMDKALRIVECEQSRHYNPFMDFIYSLEDVQPLANWDRAFIDLLKVEDNIVATESLRLLTRAIFSRQFKPEQTFMEQMIIIAGNQGTGKSTFFRRLGDPLNLGVYGWVNNSLDVASFCDTKLCIERTTNCILVELGELRGWTKTEAGAMKQALSTNVRQARKSFNRRDSRVVQRFTVVGTTNEHNFLQDPTGYRRFIVLDSTLPTETSLVHDIMTVDWLKSFWKAAYNDYMEHCNDYNCLLLSAEAMKLVHQSNDQHEVEDPTETAVEQYINETRNDYTVLEDNGSTIKLALEYKNTAVSAEDVWRNALHSAASRANLDIIKFTKSDSTKIGMYLSKLCSAGWSRTHRVIDGVRTRRFERDDTYAKVVELDKSKLPGYIKGCTVFTKAIVDKYITD